MCGWEGIIRLCCCGGGSKFKAISSATRKFLRIPTASAKVSVVFQPLACSQTESWCVSAALCGQRWRCAEAFRVLGGSMEVKKCLFDFKDEDNQFCHQHMTRIFAAGRVKRLFSVIGTQPRLCWTASQSHCIGFFQYNQDLTFKPFHVALGIKDSSIEGPKMRSSTMSWLQ